MFLTRLTSKSQTTLPKPIRDALGVGPGDSVAFSIEGGRAVVVKAPNAEDTGFLQLLEPSLAEEWLSPEDCEAYDDLL